MRTESTRAGERLEILLSPDQIDARIDELAAQIRSDYGSASILLVGVLKGSYMFLSELSRRIAGPVTIDFVQTSSYGDQKSSSGVVQIRKDLDVNIEGMDVLLVEDIVDTGATLAHLRELFATRKPKSIRVVTLLSKPEAHKTPTPVEYVGFEIPNSFVVGYGLDYGERFRNLPYVALFLED